MEMTLTGRYGLSSQGLIMRITNTQMGNRYSVLVIKMDLSRRVVQRQHVSLDGA